MQEQQPSEPLEGRFLRLVRLSPLLFANFVYGRQKRLGNVEMIQHQHGVGAMVLNRSYIRLAHITTRPGNGRTLPGRKLLLEKKINGLASFPFAHPHDAVTIQIIHDGREFASFAIRYLIDPNTAQPPYAVAFSQPLNRAVEQARQG